MEANSHTESTNYQKSLLTSISVKNSLNYLKNADKKESVTIVRYIKKFPANLLHDLAGLINRLHYLKNHISEYDITCFIRVYLIIPIRYIL